jgi:mono/diheme cytochrome c family protein
MRTALLSALLLARVTIAADADRGASLYLDRCATCHSAAHDAVEKQGQAPDLVKRMKSADPARLTQWMLEPKSRKKESACNTSALQGDPEAVANLWAYLQGHLDAAPAPRVDRHRDELSTSKTWQWHNRKRGEP